MSSNQKQVKAVIIGDGACGKTCILTSFTSNTFPSSYLPTVFDNYFKLINVDGQEYNIALWDTAGQEDYDRLRPLSYPSTDVFLITFSLVNRKSFEQVTAKWFPEIQQHFPNSRFVLVGTKKDLREDSSTIAILQSKGQSAVTQAEGEALATKLNADHYHEVSSLTQSGIQRLFEIVTQVSQKEKPAGYGAAAAVELDDGRTFFTIPKLQDLSKVQEVVSFLKSIIPLQEHADVGIDVSQRKFKGKIGVTCGDFNDVGSSISLKYKTGSDASDVLTTLQMTQLAKPLLIAVSFSVKDSVDPFSLGELSGTVKNIVGLAMDKLKYELKTKMESDYDGRSIYTLIFSFSAQTEVHDVLEEALNFYQPSKVNGTIEFSSSPSPQSQSSLSFSSGSNDDFIQLKANLELELSRNVFRLIEGSLHDANTDVQSRKLLGTFRSTKEVSLGLEFDDVAEFYQSVTSDDDSVPPFLKTINWNSLKAGSGLMLQKLTEEKVPEPLREAYQKVTEYLTGLKSVRIVAGKSHAIELTTKDLPIFTLLPTLEELLKMKEGGED